jgi:hypothetical protein
MTDPALPDPALRELLDRQQIGDLLARYCERLDEYDIEGVAATFTGDAITDYGPGRGGEVVGRPQIATRIADGQASFRRTAHQLGQSLVTIDGDRADATTYVTAWHEWRDDRQEALRLRYIDRLVRTDEGWLIAHRRLEAMGVEGFAGTAWTWVQRAEP